MITVLAPLFTSALVGREFDSIEIAKYGLVLVYSLALAILYDAGLITSITKSGIEKKNIVNGISFLRYRFEESKRYFLISVPFSIVLMIITGQWYTVLICNILVIVSLFFSTANAILIHHRTYFYLIIIQLISLISWLFYLMLLSYFKTRINIDSFYSSMIFRDLVGILTFLSVRKYFSPKLIYFQNNSSEILLKAERKAFISTNLWNTIFINSDLLVINKVGTLNVIALYTLVRNFGQSVQSLIMTSLNNIVLPNISMNSNKSLAYLGLLLNAAGIIIIEFLSEPLLNIMWPNLRLVNIDFVKLVFSFYNMKIAINFLALRFLSIENIGAYKFLSNSSSIVMGVFSILLILNSPLWFPFISLLSLCTVYLMYSYRSGFANVLLVLANSLYGLFLFF